MRIQIQNNRAKVGVAMVSKKELLRKETEIAKLYINVFGGPPWFEKARIFQDGNWKRVGTDEELKQVDLLLAQGLLRGEDIKPFYTEKGVVEDIRTCAASGGFIGILAVNMQTSRVVGASWGMNASQVSDLQKLRDIEIIANIRNLKMNEITYLDEMFVLAEYRNIGIGNTMLKIEGISAVRNGCTYSLCRTINPVIVNGLRRNFGGENVFEVYRDQNDEQTERRYYLTKLASIRREYED
jgi:hypothetical protein